MSFLKNILSKKETPIKSYADFWAWFQQNEKDFFSAVKNRKDIEKNFFDRLAPKLAELKDGIFFLTGMCDEHTAELALTADGITKNIVFIEELVSKAPGLNGWKFTALKPALHIEDVSIEMAGYTFNAGNIFFYSNELPGYPDEIDITIVHSDFTEESKTKITNGVYIFLDNYLAELDFVTTIDNLRIISKQDAEDELIPVIKLKEFLNWRQKEFTEKYKGTRHNTENDTYSMLEAELENGNMLLAVINTDLLKWYSKASHPWAAVIAIKYDGSNNNGMPNDKDYELLNNIEEEMMHQLKDFEGYLNIGRQTANSEREIYFACKDFRKPSKAFYGIQQKYAGQLEIEYEIFKDKYWQSFERFQQ